MQVRECLRIVVTGRVQGVFYRAEAAQKAQQLGIVGTICNRPDGSVEVIAGGPPQALAQFVEWCRRGPRQARVDSLQSETAQLPLGTDQFAILR